MDVGSAFVVFLAGLQSIPQDLYEAIVVDGARAWGRFWHVTLPMLSPVILFNLVIGVIIVPGIRPRLGTDKRWSRQRDAVLRLRGLARRVPEFQMGYASALAGCCS